jgi:UDPglucose 6-dehydrogenase
MGDGGGCHPRDNIALSWLAQRLELSVDLFDVLMRARDAQAEWLGSLAASLAQVTNLPIRICGRSFKKNTNLEVGSPSRLLANLMKWDDKAVWQESVPKEPAAFIIGVNHDCYADWRWPPGSVVLDPWGFIPDQPGVQVIRIGRTAPLPDIQTDGAAADRLSGLPHEEMEQMILPPKTCGTADDRMHARGAAMMSG